MAALSVDFNSIIQQVQSLESALSSSPQGQDPAIGSFISALDSVLAAGKSALAANSAGPTTPRTADNESGQTDLSILKATSAAPAAAASASATPKVVAEISEPTGTAHLLATGSDPDRNKPDVAQFMLLTGCDFATAAEVLYGTIGSNNDLRDWSAIMASPTPLADAKASTAGLYNSDLNFASPDAKAPAEIDLLAKSGNFEYSLEQVDPAPAEKSGVLFLCDGQGNRLRAADNPQQLSNDAAYFGFDTAALSALQAQLDATGVNYRTGVWANGFLGNS